MGGVTVDDVAAILFPQHGDGEAKEFHCWGTVESVNNDGSYQVKLNESSITTRCAACVSATTGSRVLVLVMANGQRVATAKRM